MNQTAFAESSAFFINSQENTYVAARKWFVIFCAFHFILWLLIPSLLYGNPPTDSVEGVAWGNLWLWGYEKHPFLAPWLTAFFADITGMVGWSIYFLSQLSVIVCFWAVWRLANKVLAPWHALIAVVLLEGVSYYNFQSTSFNPNVLMLPMWALTSLVFYNALTQGKLKWWILLGISAGLALLTKYESGMLFFIMLLVMLITEQGRAAFKHYGIYLSAIIAIIVFLPNLIWLAKHNFVAVAYATHELGTEKIKHLPKIIAIFLHPLKFLAEQLGTIAAAFLLYWPFYQRGKATNNGFKTFDQRFFMLMGLGPLVLILLISLFSGATLVSRWAFPFFSLTGIFLVAWLQPVITAARLKTFAVLVVALNFLMLLGSIYIFVVAPHITHKADHYEFFPGKVIANSLTQQWQDYYHTPLPYAAGMHDVVVNISAFSKDRPVPYFNWNKMESPWIDEAKMKKQGAVFVLLLTNRLPFQQVKDTIQQRYPQLTHESIESFPRLTRAQVPPVKLWVAFLPPNSQ